jgi:hypothetical protein
MKPMIYTTYAELMSVRRMFMADFEPMDLIIVGKPGIGKTHAFKRTLGKEGEDFGYISGKATPSSLYLQLYAAKNLPIVIDDVDDALTDPQKRNLLKNAMENEREKTIRWGSTTSKLVDDWGNKVDRTFVTTSHFCIIVNELTQKVSGHLSALMSRAFVIDFVPSAEEVHGYVADFFDDEEVFIFIEQFINIITVPDIRDYEKARKLRLHGGPWQTMLLNNWMNTDRDFAVILRVMNDPQLTTLQQRAQAYVQLTGSPALSYVKREQRINQVRSVLERHGLLR